MCPFHVDTNGDVADLVARQAAERLREASRIFSIAERLAHLGRWRLGARENEIERSPQASAIFGIGPAETFTPAAALSQIHPDDRFSLLRCLVRGYHGLSDVSCRTRLRARDGTERTVVVHAQSDHGRDGKRSAIFGVVRDVSDEVASENALIAARDEARAATRAKSEFLATMSHEIRTPMTGVVGMIDLISTAADEEEKARYLAAMRYSAHMLISVLDSILDFSKAEAGRIEIADKPFDLVDLARQTILLFANAGSAKGIALQFEADPAQSPLVRGDSLRLQQVMSNFISNAVKFTVAGSVLLSLRASPSREGFQHWRIDVRDTGAGIDPAQIDRLFEPFIQVGNCPSGGGTGLGLAISRRLVEAMGGKASVRSTLGQGSTFSVELELAIAPAVPESVAESAAAGGGSTRPLNVLVAEDNSINQLLIVAMLGRLGHRAVAADNGRRAVECATAEPFDCILMDMQMPEMDGVAATRAIREGGGINAGARIIALTADASLERRRFYDNVGLSGFMTKPIDADELHRMLSEKGAFEWPHESSVTSDRTFDDRQLEELGDALGPDKLRTLLGLAKAELTEGPRLIRRLAGDEDLDRMRYEAHSLRGAVANLGLDSVARAARAVELAAPGPELALALDRFDREAARGRVAIGQVLGRSAAPASATG